MTFEKLVRILLRLIIASSVLGSCFCLISGGFALFVVNHTPRRGDNMGLGIICISIPLATFCAVVILAAIEKWLLRRGI
jgi:hypothetical protein